MYAATTIIFLGRITSVLFVFLHLKHYVYNLRIGCPALAIVVLCDVGYHVVHCVFSRGGAAAGLANCACGVTDTVELRLPGRRKRRLAMPSVFSACGVCCSVGACSRHAAVCDYT